MLARQQVLQPYNATTMANNATPRSNPSQIDHIAERVDRLLLRHAELQRTHELLTQQVQTLERERDSLKSRLGLARARVDALLERLPDSDHSAKNTP
jgi:chromosome segregation ATPase